MQRVLGGWHDLILSLLVPFDRLRTRLSDRSMPVLSCPVLLVCAIRQTQCCPFLSGLVAFENVCPTSHSGSFLSRVARVCNSANSISPFVSCLATYENACQTLHSGSFLPRFGRFCNSVVIILSLLVPFGRLRKIVLCHRIPIPYGFVLPVCANMQSHFAPSCPIWPHPNSCAPTIVLFLLVPCCSVV